MHHIDTLTASSSLQRDGRSHQAIEDYLKTIYALAEAETPVSTSRIAEAHHVRPGSVTSMLHRLAKLNLVDYEKHYGVTLTAAGKKIALEVIRHHRLLELYLSEALGFGWDEVHEQADVLEHVISEEFEERIAAILGHPTLDPHGDPIPDKDGVMVVIPSQSLTSLAVGQEAAQITRITDDANGDMLRYLAELGLTPGTAVQVLQAAPFDGPLTVKINNREVVIGRTIANVIFVTA